MMKLTDIFPDDPDDGTEIVFIDMTFTYYKNKKVWTHEPEQNVEFRSIDRVYVIRPGQSVLFNKETVDWNLIKDF